MKFIRNNLVVFWGLVFLVSTLSFGYFSGLFADLGLDYFTVIVFVIFALLAVYSKLAEYQLTGKAVADNMKGVLEERDEEKRIADDLDERERRLNLYEQELNKYHKLLDKQAAEYTKK